ncbi:MAG: DeoR/GlpR family DNA-binding transcription regulator [Lactobacillales bacterium]|jgi:DeoR/GlpR family transcriptional regulator of sugar metabolism|nr:DeoR/GlpR family DNA-binding transcription regulator [Lactobacillales bacterium]
MKLSTKERQKEIMNYLITHEVATVGELAELFAVTTETIRKDLTLLEDEKMIDKGHGTVKIAHTFYENPFDIKDTLLVNEKIKIGERAAKLVIDVQVIYIDSSTTGIKLAKILSIADLKDLTIITNSINVAKTLASSPHHVLVLGGEMRKRSQSIVGAWAIQAASTIKADIAFMGCDGFSASGATNRTFPEIALKQEIIKNAKSVYMLADNSKFETETTYTFANYEDITGIITDVEPSGLGNIPKNIEILY